MIVVPDDQFGLRRAWDLSVPDPFLKRLATLIIDARREAVDHCGRNFPAPEAHDLRPYQSRARIESGLIGLAGEFPSITVMPESNVGGNCYHREVTSGRIIFTVSAASHPGKLVSKAVFRKRLAQRFQLTLFDSELPQMDAIPVYAVVIHGVYSKDQAETDFIRIAFPNDDFTAYLDSINVLERFSDLRRQDGVVDIEEPEVRLRSDVKRRNRTVEREA